MNLAVIGFGAASLICAVYAYTFEMVTHGKLPAYVRRFAFAYFALAASFLFWALASVVPSFLPVSVLIGNVGILLGTIALLTVLAGDDERRRTTLVAVGGVAALLFLIIRVVSFFPVPFMNDGVLVFNTQPPIAVTLGLIFAFIWLPASVRVGRAVAAALKIPGIDLVYSFLYGLSTVAAVLLISFRTVPMVVAAFTVVGVCFAMLLYSNAIVHQLLTKHRSA